jgi:hypothetical protein
MPTLVIACVLFAVSVGAAGEPKQERSPAPAQPKPPVKLKTAVELVGDFKEAVSAMRASPLSIDNERALHDAAQACLLSKDEDAVKFVCDSAVALGVYPLWRAIRDFENQVEVMEPAVLRAHLSSRAAIITARLELELRGTYRPVLGGRGEFSIRPVDERVYYLRGQYWLGHSSALRWEWVANRLAIMNSDLATAALKDMIADGEEREKLYPGTGCPQLPKLKTALQLNELVRKADTPTKAAVSLVTLQSLGDPQQTKFVFYALRLIFYSFALAGFRIWRREAL